MVATTALAKDVVLAPNNVFSVSQTASAFIRFNLAQSDHPRIWAVLERALSTSDEDRP